MKFSLGNKVLLLIDRHGIRWHRAPEGTHFEVQLMKGTPMHILKPDAVKESLSEMRDSVGRAVAQQSVNEALLFHADRTEELLKRVLRAKNSAEAAELVATEIKVTEERMQEREEARPV